MNTENKLTEPEQRLAQRFSQHLDASAQEIDSASLSRLNQARHAAIDQYQPHTRRWLWPSTLAAAASFALAIMLWQAPVAPELIPAAGGTLQAQDLDLLSADESLEMVKDLEFYAWLDTQQLSSGG